MAPPIKTFEPLAFNKGDTVKWAKNLPDYLPSDGWVLKYSFANSGASNTITCTDNGDGSHLATIDKTTSAAFAAGHWNWQAYVESATERFTVAEGAIEVLAAMTAATDGRSHARIVLDNIEAYLENSSNITAASYSIAGRTLSRIPINELISLRDTYRREVRSEENAQRAASGLPGKNQIRVRL